MPQPTSLFNNNINSSSFIQNEDGSLLIPDVILMLSGQWMNSAGDRTEFSPEVLRKSAGQWLSNQVWAAHTGGLPRSITEAIGSVQNPHFDANLQAVVGNIFLHGKTSASKDAIQLVQLPEDSGGIKSVSVEASLDLSSKIINGWHQVSDVIFTGLAVVQHGACSAARLPAYERFQGDLKMTDKRKKEKKPVKVEESAGKAELLKTALEHEEECNPSSIEEEEEEEEALPESTDDNLDKQVLAAIAVLSAKIDKFITSQDSKTEEDEDGVLGSEQEAFKAMQNEFTEMKKVFEASVKPKMNTQPKMKATEITVPETEYTVMNGTKYTISNNGKNKVLSFKRL